jgi:hypothetical protein
MMNRHTTTTSTTDSTYFTEPATGEVTNAKSLNMPALTKSVQTTTSGEMQTNDQLYQQSAHTVVVKRYVIKRT